MTRLRKMMLEDSSAATILRSPDIYLRVVADSAKFLASRPNLPSLFAARVRADAGTVIKVERLDQH